MKIRNAAVSVRCGECRKVCAKEIPSDKSALYKRTASLLLYEKHKHKTGHRKVELFTRHHSTVGHVNVDITVKPSLKS